MKKVIVVIGGIIAAYWYGELALKPE